MMTCVVFENAGEIDPLAMTTFGVSAKVCEDPIGFFGTGLKYAVAILLRTGCGVTVLSGERAIAFGVQSAVIRGKSFDVVTVDGAPAGFTTDVGKSWGLWMAYRELYCNARDEGGCAYECAEAPPPTAGLTRVVVSGEDFAEVHRARDEFILCGREPDWELEGVRVYLGESRSVFYRGMRVYTLPDDRVCKYTYDVARKIDLTEDRTAKYPGFLPMYVATALMEAPPEAEDLVRSVIDLPDRYFEHKLNFRPEGTWGVPAPGPAFIRAVEAASANRAGRTNFSAMVRYREEKRRELPVASAAGATALTAVEAKALERAVAFCTRHGFPVEEYALVVADSLGGDVLGMAEGDRVYLSRRALMQGTKVAAGTLIEEFVHLRYGHADESRGLQNFLLDRLVSAYELVDGEPL